MQIGVSWRASVRTFLRVHHFLFLGNALFLYDPRAPQIAVCECWAVLGAAALSVFYLPARRVWNLLS